MISVVQGTELAIQPVGVGINLTPGQILGPVNDLVEQFSSLMLTASIAFGIQKVLLSIGSHWLISLIVTVVTILWAVLFLLRRCPGWLSRILVVLLMVRFAIPAVTEKFKTLLGSIEQATEHVVRLMAIFLLQTLVIPVVLLWILYRLATSAFRPFESPGG